MKGLRSLAARAILGLALIASVPEADADLITFNFQATVTFSPVTGVSVGDTILGSYTFESTTPDANPLNAQVGQYNSAVTAVSFSVGPYSATLGAAAIQRDILVENLVVPIPGSGDFYTLFVSDVDGPTVNGFTPGAFAISLRDASATGFTDDSLPAVPPDLALFSAPGIVSCGSSLAELCLPFFPFGNFIRGDLISLTLPATVPLPSTLLLFASGLTGLLALRGRHRAA